TVESILTQKCSDQEKGNQYLALFENLPIIKDINAIIENWSQVHTLSDIINKGYELENGMFPIKLLCTDFNKEIEALTDILIEVLLKDKIYSIEEIYKDFRLALEHKKMFTLKQVREELGYKRYETFQPWLRDYFGDKYINRNDTNGYINIYEYEEIVTAFFLDHKESELDLENNILDYKERLDNQMLLKSKDLKYIANKPNNFMGDVQIVSENNNVKTPKDARLFPFNRASLILAELPKLYSDDN
ncbi:MAG: hypothetical protein CL817_06065, partial [Croceibacter sp.]|nr:hypothetical protein [Croceibacter sp.]